MEKELNLYVKPDRTLHLEWSQTDETVTKGQILLQDEIHKRFTANPIFSLLFLGFSDKTIRLSGSINYWRDFSGLFAKKLSLTPDLETIRDKVDPLLEEDEISKVIDSVPIMTGAEYINKELIVHLWSTLKETYSNSIKSFKGSVEEFIKSFSPNIHLAGCIFFHLVENKNSDLPFAFLATYSTALDKRGKSKHLPLKAALKEYGENNDKLLNLLSTVHLAAKESPMINELLESGELFHPLAWTADEAYTFLKETSIYENSGILCRIPNWWKGKKSSISFQINIGDKQPSLVGMDAILDFNPQLLLGDTTISITEAKNLLQESEGLVFIKNRWVSVDSEKLKQTLDVYEKAKKIADNGDLTLRDAMRLHLNPKAMLNLEKDDSDIGISNGKWFESLLLKLRNPDLITEVKPDKRFKAILRDYQQKGLNWLSFLHSLRFGACLADDMGLGKTVQLLAFLNVLKSQGNNKASLLIIPASLIANWSDEINKFFPDLKYYIAHSAAHQDKKVIAKDNKSLDKYDLVITTYTLSQKYKWLQEYNWNYLILDEAQAIKNPGTKQTRSVKKLTANNKIVMTGTPIENRLSDLWSIFDFTNPGLLGTTKEFSNFSKGLKDNPQGYSRLRHLISPYILRRLKTDKSIISDLPDKVEVKTYSHLTKKQVLLYENYVQELCKILDNTETDNIKRKGLILSSIIKFKQLCNHPDQFLGTGDYLEKDSGKLERLREICETILEKREKVLVFTQFKEITEPLAEFLKEVFGRDGLILHGGIVVKKRKKIIEQFQSADYIPFIVLSLKAGGVGLNLTEANHVVHFDRWWNPAVENQATDRAFRIGQKKNVMVHKFITKGTIEEKIDIMLEEKSKLSNDIMQNSGEALITEMDNNQLTSLFKLTL